MCVCVRGDEGGREGVLALSFLRIWFGIKDFIDIHGIRATR